MAKSCGSKNMHSKMAAKMMGKSSKKGKK